MYWCCRTAASRLSLFSAWPHHSTPASAPNLPPTATPSVIIYFPPVISFSILSIPTLYTQVCSLRSPWISFGLKLPTLPLYIGWLLEMAACAANLLGSLIDRENRNVQTFYSLFILFFSSTFSDRYSYYYRPPTVLVKFFAYPVTSFYTYRV